MDIKTYQVQTNVEEMHKKIKSHRKKFLAAITFVIAVILVTVVGLYIYYESKVYDSYMVKREIVREDSYGSNFVEFNGKILKYSNDGAFYFDGFHHFIWSQTFDMQNPIVDVCEEYVVIADKKGKQIFVSDSKGTFEKFTTKSPIQQVHVANQGVVAVLVKEDGAGAIQIFDKKGKMLAGGEKFTQDGGSPLDISISKDCKKLATAALDFKDGKIKTNITFFNFDTFGQNMADNVVASYSYEDTVVPKIDFITDNQMVAFGSDKIVIFEGTHKPVEKKVISIKENSHSIFYNSKYFGITYEKESSSYQLVVFDLKGNEVLNADFKMDYNEIEFLQNDEICIRNDFECTLLKISNVEKFSSKFKKEIQKIFSTNNKRNYIILFEGTTEEIRIK